MKIFWSIIAVLAILTAGLLIDSRDMVAPAESGDPLPRRVFEAGAAAESPWDDPRVDTHLAPPPELNVTAGEIADPPKSRDDSNAANPDRLRLNPWDVTSPDSSKVAPSNEGDAPALTPNTPAEIIVEPKVEPEPFNAQRDARVSALEVEPVAEDGQVRHPVATAHPFESLESMADDETAARDDAPAAAPEMVHPTFEKRDDGSTLVDGRFVVRGKGTKTHPFQVPWNMLVATSESYDPRANTIDLPERLTMLSGTYVRVVGHVAFPVDAQGPDELLVMLHAWDGCCVGVRPSPCDAIEVRLENPATSEQMLMSWGGVTGRFKAQPHLARNGSLKLYTMEEAVLTEDNK